MKWPMWLRVVLGAAAMVLSVVLGYLLIPVLGDMSMLLAAAGLAAFVYLNPELMRGD